MPDRKEPHLSWRRTIGKTIQRYRRPPPSKPTIDPRLYTELQAHFAPEIERLGRLLNRGLSHRCS